MSTNAARPVPSREADLPDNEAVGTAGKPRILLVDEQAHVLRVMRMNLDRQGYDVESAQHAETVLEQMGKSRFDALIMTSAVPGTGTQQLINSAMRLCNEVHPLVLVTCDDTGEWIDDVDYIERLDDPISLRRIVSRLGEAFGQSGN